MHRLTGGLLPGFPVVLAATIFVAASGAQVALARTIEVGSATGSPGWVVPLQVSLSGSAGTVGTENQIAFVPSQYRIRAKADGSPDCAINPSINKANSAFGFLPFGCINDECDQVRAIVISTDNVQVLPDGVLFTCQLQIGLTTPPNTYQIFNLGAAAANSVGQTLAVTPGNGSVHVTQSCGCGCP